MRNAQFATGPRNEILARTALDARADGGRRMILLAPRCVTIRRHLRGMKMQLRVPVESYTGVVLSRENRPAGALFNVRLWHRDPELSVTLRASNDRSTSVEAWHQWSAYFAMPALIERGGRHVEPLETPLGTAIGALPRPRSGHRAERRHRLALCRKTALARVEAKIFRSERGIIRYE